MIDCSISIVIPVYNGRKYMDELIKRTIDAASDFSLYEILLVDDASPDKSYEKICQLASDYPSVKGILLDGNHGQQSATLCGIRHSSGEFVVIMDDDLENPPESIHDLYRELKKGYDAVYALDESTDARSFLRKTGSAIRDITFRLLTDIPKGMKVCSYRIMNKKTAELVSDANTPFVYISMEILKYTSNISNICIPYGNRKKGGHSVIKLMGLILKLYIYYSNLLKIFRKTGETYKISKTTGVSG